MTTVVFNHKPLETDFNSFHPFQIPKKTAKPVNDLDIQRPIETNNTFVPLNDECDLLDCIYISNVISAPKSCLLFRNIILKNVGGDVNVRALLDSGASACVLPEKCVSGEKVTESVVLA